MSYRSTPLIVALASLLVVGGCAPRLQPVRAGPANSLPPATRNVMGESRLSPAQLAGWFNSRPAASAYRATVPVEALIEYYIEEGASEGVAGDIAFVQAVVETGWFRFEGLVPASSNNFAGIGATGRGAGPAAFPDARVGVRAQIQHLRAYADPGALACTVPPLRNACADPRFDLVVPKGKAASWNDMGGGNWAASREYAGTILKLYEEALAFQHLP